MRYFDVTYKVAKQYEIILKDKQLRQIKAWYETKKGDGTISAESEEVLKEILNKGAILKKVGSKVKVIINEVIRPKVIIHPKSIIGLISLKIKDKNAKIVVNAVYKIGQNIFLVVKEMISKLFLEGEFFLSCKNLVLM